MKNKKTIIAFTILIFAVVSFAYGVYSGEMEVVVDKAVRICLECCGIG